MVVGWDCGSGKGVPIIIVGGCDGITTNLGCCTAWIGCTIGCWAAITGCGVATLLLRGVWGL